MNKKQDILQAAERLFYLNGFHATSTDRICSEAGVSTRTLYRYFPSREALTWAVMDARSDRFFAALLAPEDPQAINQLFDVMSRWMTEHGTRGCFFLKAWGEYAAMDATLADKAMAYRHAMRAYIARCVGQPNTALTDAIWLLFEGVLTTSLILGAVAACEAGKMAALQLLSGRDDG